jgi:hypothetical protein
MKIILIFFMAFVLLFPLGGCKRNASNNPPTTFDAADSGRMIAGDIAADANDGKEVGQDETSDEEMPSGAKNPPTVSTIKKIMKEIDVDVENICHEALPLGDGRYVSIVFTGDEDLIALVISENAGKAHVESMADLPLEGYYSYPEYWGDDGQYPKVAKLEKGDFDNDGEIEIQVNVRYYTAPHPGVGGSERWKLFVIDVDPSARVALSLMYKEITEADTLPDKLGSVEFEDQTGDGHGDAVVKGKECVWKLQADGWNWKEICKPFEKIYSWHKVTDKWIISKP